MTVSLFSLTNGADEKQNCANAVPSGLDWHAERLLPAVHADAKSPPNSDKPSPLPAHRLCHQLDQSSPHIDSLSIQQDD
ncbi:hypothetical protein LB554_29220 [Mesorhizobium sp. CO1-1-11]|uniref:hypothetical protein n=1 Tax=Mesorhizobium sp. CO1-1-11 TaxID=2876636 RepID=UPI001CCAF78F|nr:hypothetical protein [Mesorhizobium sp. CO1-1-11]MBZ9728030.1 hypothetical protein [Mesorhizobium sp. CO1-1-11]